MAGRRDLGIKVSNAIRLNDLAFRLSQDFAACPPVEGDEWIGRFWTNDVSPEGRDWMHRCNTKRVAEVLIAKAIREGVLELWVRLEDGEASVDHYSIQLFGARDVATGSYNPYSHLDHALYGRPLWVKNTDWPIFREAVIRARYPKEIAEAERALAAPDAKASPSKGKVADKSPNLSKAQLQQWWTALTDEQRQLPQDQLWMLCRSAFPGQSITRRRIRDLTGPRKRGKKPIR
jgi:hypothetical protein